MGGHPDIVASVLRGPARRVQDVPRIFLDASHGQGGLPGVVDEAGSTARIADPRTPVTVARRPR